MEEFLRALLPRLLGDSVSFNVHPYQCKDDLLNKLPARLKGYKNWIPKTWRIVVVVDRDDDDCHGLKQKIEQMFIAAGLQSRTVTMVATWQIVSRIAIDELESWYFGDWEAVRTAYSRVPANLSVQAKYRDPDAIKGTWEAFERVLKKAGYFKGGLRKIEVARVLGGNMDPARNQSRSFQVFRDAILEAIS
ncbi:DUF4276 family protein [Gammaproteobacteria bacterium]